MNARLRLPGPFLIRLTLWLVVYAVFPLSGTAVRYSFEAEVLGRTTPTACFEEFVRVRDLLADRVCTRLVEAEFREPDAWYRDDYRIARVAVGLARQGSPIPHIEASYQVLGVHPDQVWPHIVARREAMLGADSLKLCARRKPVRSVTLEEFWQQSRAA